MSTTINNNYGVNRLSFEDELKAVEKKRATVAWYNPAKDNARANNGDWVRPDTIFLGEHNGTPTYEEPVLDVGKFRQAIRDHKKAIKEGSLSSFDFGKYEDPWLDDWSGINQNRIAAKRNGQLKSAAVGTNSDFAAVDVVNVLAQMVNTELRNFVLEQAVTHVGTPQLNINFDTYTRFTASSGVPEGIAPQSKRPSVTRLAINLTKDVAHVVFTDEAQLRASHPILQQAINTATTDLGRLRSNKTAVELETASSTALGATWSAQTSGVSTQIPSQDLGTQADVIFANNGQPTQITSHDKTFRAFLVNSWIKGVIAALPVPNLSQAKVIQNVPGLPGFEWFIDNEHTNSIATILDKESVYFMDGPVRLASYRMEQEGLDGMVYRDWNGVKTIIGGRIRKLTNTA